MRKVAPLLDLRYMERPKGVSNGQGRLGTHGRTVGADRSSATETEAEQARRHRPDFTRLVGTGGMPSAHAASVTALSVAVGIGQGWQSPLFGVAAFLSLVVMYDATGIRRAAGRQAQILNRMLEEMKDYHRLDPERLTELLGHTPFEVFVGAAYGALLAFALHP